MASEREVFDFCDRYFTEHGQPPSANTIVENCGGGKKQVLQHRAHWKEVHDLNDSNIPTHIVAQAADNQSRLRRYAEEQDIEFTDALKQLNEVVLYHVYGQK